MASIIRFLVAAGLIAPAAPLLTAAPAAFALWVLLAVALVTSSLARTRTEKYGRA